MQKNQLPAGRERMLLAKLKIVMTLSLILFLPAQSFAEFDYQLYGKILNKYVFEGKIINGINSNAVDYKGLFKESQNLKSDYSKYLRQFARFNPESLFTNNDKIAFWINAVNIGAIKMILDHYPVDSIKSIKINFLKNPWDKKILNINGRLFSLREIEHDILLGRYKEKLAHFGMNCASVSCPDISTKVYTGKSIKKQLEKQAREFFKNPAKGFYIDKIHNKVFVSRIFKFDSKNFSQGRNDIVPFILPFINDKKDREYLKQNNFKLEYFHYDWRLNSLSSARPQDERKIASDNYVVNERTLLNKSKINNPLFNIEWLGHTHNSAGEPNWTDSEGTARRVKAREGRNQMGCRPIC